MTIKYTTPVPNNFFDEQLVQLSGSALRVLLKIYRNTYGWRNQYGEVKKRDWISHRQFSDVGVSSRSVTSAVEELLDHDLITVTNEQGDLLHDPRERRHVKRIYYAPKQKDLATTAHNKANFDKNNVDNHHNNAKDDTGIPQILPTTKDILQKSSTQQTTKQNGLLTDRQRLNQIMSEEERKQFNRNRWL